MINKKAIIFDCFGVLVEASLEPFCDKYLGKNAEKLARVREFDNKANSGLISYDDFVEKLALLADIPIAEAREFLDNNPANERLFSYIQDDLYGNYKIGLLSNASDNWMDELFSAEQIELFDDVVLSFMIGVAKPDRSIYLIAAKRLNVDPSDCVFVDDIMSYCEAAEKTGMKAIHYESLTQLKRDLSLVLID